jgi:hypothetical protein
VVHAAPPEGEVPVRVPGEVKGVGVLEVPLVVVGRAEDRQNELATGHDRTRDLYVLAYAVDTAEAKAD